MNIRKQTVLQLQGIMNIRKQTVLQLQGIMNIRKQAVLHFVQPSLKSNHLRVTLSVFKNVLKSELVHEVKFGYRYCTVEYNNKFKLRFFMHCALNYWILDFLKSADITEVHSKIAC